ncbi:MAG: LLM class flavin-dependent oxidoreductase, partial [Acidimicrobiia bacterium]
MTSFFYFCGHEQFQPETLVRHAELAEKAGFDGLLVSEHFHPWVDDESASGFAFATIAAMAVATTKVQIATGVATPLFRFHPAMVAQAAATLDRLSRGRFHLGVGTGENINEGPLGYAFPAYPERAARMREALEIMRRLLDGEKLTYQGTYYRTDRAKLYSPPVGRVPIWMAAGGPK